MKNEFEEKSCPACFLIGKFGDKWSLLILMILNENGVLRFNEIFRKIPNISQKMLTITLKTLGSSNLISRKMYPEIPPRVEYQLTKLGESLVPYIQSLVDWAKEHSEEILKNEEKSD